MRARCRSLLLRLLPLLLPACALLGSGPQLPEAKDVSASRARNAAEWVLLGRAWKLGSRQGPEALAPLCAAHPESLRLRALRQDFELEDAAKEPDGVAELRRRYARRAERSGSAEDAYLAARIASRTEAKRWLDLALLADPGLVPAQVLDLGMQAHAGDSRPLDQLIQLLRDHPDSAEGWRLLARLAPLYARPELASRAAEQEPWVPEQTPRLVALLQARTALAREDPETAVAALLGLEDRDARLLRASAYTALGRIAVAAGILDSLILEDPGDPIAHFDRGLLALDYQHEDALAARELRRFLELAREGKEAPVRRLAQARLWLERLESTSRQP